MDYIASVWNCKFIFDDDDDDDDEGCWRVVVGWNGVFYDNIGCEK